MTANSNAAASEPAGLSKILKRAFGLIFVSGLLGLFSLVAKWDEAEGVQRRLCVDWTLTHDAMQSSGQCMKKFQELPTSEAETTIRAFVSKVMGDPKKALELMGPSYKQNPAHDDFLASWEDAAWVERVSEVTRSPENFNEFDVTLRSYRVKHFKTAPSTYNYWAAQQVVDVRSYTLRLERQQTGPTIVLAIKPGKKLYGHSRHFPLGTFNVDTYGRFSPGSDDHSSNATDVRKGTSERVLCVTPDGLHYGTYIGWFPTSEVDLSQEEPDPLLVCGLHGT